MIKINSLLPDYSVRRFERFRPWLVEVIKTEQKTTGAIQYVLCDDEYLLDINKRFLQHDTYTDIITFPESYSEDIISGEIYISLPRVEENATINKVSFEHELARVFVHGVLHLIGYEDANAEQKRVMRAKEDYYLPLLPQNL